MSDFTEPKRCVIADDVRASRETVAIWLRECGFQCELADNGQQAWQLINDHPPELIVTDLEMPQLSGLELLEKIRRADDARICSIPVLIMTSLRDGQTLRIIQEMGGDGMLPKPLSKHMTLSTILELVSVGHCLLPTRDHQARTDDTEHGVISPTLRRLLKTVANHERSS